jgi:hypothetical protein
MPVAGAIGIAVRTAEGLGMALYLENHGPVYAYANYEAFQEKEIAGLLQQPLIPILVLTAAQESASEWRFYFEANHAPFSHGSEKPESWCDISLSVRLHVDQRTGLLAPENSGLIVDASARRSLSATPYTFDEPDMPGTLGTALEQLQSRYDVPLHDIRRMLLVGQAGQPQWYIPIIMSEVSRADDPVQALREWCEKKHAEGEADIWDWVCAWV